MKETSYINSKLKQFEDCLADLGYLVEEHPMVKKAQMLGE